MFKFKFVQMVAVFIFILLLSLITGRGFVKTDIHESGNAQYIHSHYCMVDNTIKQEEYKELLEWCSVKYFEGNK